MPPFGTKRKGFKCLGFKVPLPLFAEVSRFKALGCWIFWAHKSVYVFSYSFPRNTSSAVYSILIL